MNSKCVYMQSTNYCSMVLKQKYIILFDLFQRKGYKRSGRERKSWVRRERNE